MIFALGPIASSISAALGFTPVVPGNPEYAPDHYWFAVDFATRFAGSDIATSPVKGGLLNVVGTPTLSAIKTKYVEGQSLFLTTGSCVFTDHPINLANRAFSIATIVSKEFNGTVFSTVVRHTNLNFGAVDAGYRLTLNNGVATFEFFQGGTDELPAITCTQSFDVSVTGRVWNNIEVSGTHFLNMRIHVNGIPGDFVSYASAVDSNLPMIIGGNYSTTTEDKVNTSTSGHMEHIRVYLDLCRYPSTSPIWGAYPYSAGQYGREDYDFEPYIDTEQGIFLHIPKGIDIRGHTLNGSFSIINGQLSVPCSMNVTLNSYSGNSSQSEISMDISPIIKFKIFRTGNQDVEIFNNMVGTTGWKIYIEGGQIKVSWWNYNSFLDRTRNYIVYADLPAPSIDGDIITFVQGWSGSSSISTLMCNGVVLESLYNYPYPPYDNIRCSSDIAYIGGSASAPGVFLDQLSITCIGYGEIISEYHSDYNEEIYVPYETPWVRVPFID